jgi:uncharacterized OB-fold protein
MRTIVIDALERTADTVSGEGVVWLVHGHVKDHPEVRVIVTLKDGENKWQGSNVVGQMMDGASHEVEVNLQAKAVWISVETGSDPPKRGSVLKPRSF